MNEPTKEMKFDVLDHGYVALVDYMGTDLSPLASARMSTNNPTGADEKKDDSLRKRLWKDSHTSPFERNVLVVEVQCPIFVLRQIDRHRTVKYDELTITVESVDTVMREFTNRNEFSGRYSEMPDIFFVPETDRVQRKGVTNKQGSADPLPAEVQYEVRKKIQNATRVARETYEEIIAAGVASEIARVALPLNQYTKVQLQASLLNWFKFLDLRLRPDVQLETRVYAQKIAHIVKTLWPKCWEVFEENTLGAMKISRTDRKVLADVLFGLGAPSELVRRFELPDWLG